jgi:hypothetical protein
MNCRDMKIMLSAYANDELTPSEIQKVERHLTGCEKCRSMLDSYRNLKEEISILQSNPVKSDIKASLIADIKANIASNKQQHKQFKPILVGISIAIALIAVLVIWQPWSSSSDSQNMIAKAQEAFSNIQSYRMNEISILSVEGHPSETSISKIEYIAPDRYHQTIEGTVFSVEYINIGDTQYSKGPEMAWSSTNIWSISDNSTSVVSREYTVMILEYLDNIDILADEKVDGIACFHYHGKFDFEKYLRNVLEQNTSINMPTLHKEEILEQIQQIQSQVGSITVELWFGKDDYLIRRMISSAHKQNINGEKQTSQTELSFFDFNNQLLIEAPLDQNGNLLSGWIMVSP